MARVIVRQAKKTEVPQLVQMNSENLKEKLIPETRESTGFVLKCYPAWLVEAILNLEPVLVAEIDGDIAGYLYPTPDYFREKLPALGSRLLLFDQITYKGVPVPSFRFVEIGMTVVKAAYRRRGVFRRLVEEMERRYAGQYQLLTARIAEGNKASLKTHKRIGFEEIATGQEGEHRFHVLVKPLSPSARL